MRKMMMTVGGAVCAAALTLTSGGAMATQPDEGRVVSFPDAPNMYLRNYILVDGHKVTYCHRTGSLKNPYVIVTSDLKSVDDLDPMTTDHQHHEQVGNGLGPDIIPISDVVKRNVDLVAIDLCVDDNGYPPNGSYS